MGVDIRLPIGGMFSIFGAVLVVYGIMTYGNEMYERSLGHNVNLIWGAVMLVFGLLMLVPAMRKKAATPSDGAACAKNGDKNDCSSCCGH